MLKNYKIKVNNEAESKEAQELFKQLGYKLVECHRVGMVAVNDSEIYPDVIGNWDEYNGKELTLPQLRDLVVLHRNDVNDANYKSHTDFYYVTEMYDYYFWNGHKWCESSQDSINGLTEIIKSTVEKGLISGADALRALADGREVEYKTRINYWNLINKNDAYALSLFLDDDSSFSFRLKPRTIKLSLEIPAPFEPKVGDYFYVICPTSFTGYTEVFAENQKNLECFAMFGAWRNEEEIKQVVAALRGAICKK